MNKCFPPKTRVPLKANLHLIHYMHSPRLMPLINSSTMLSGYQATLIGLYFSVLLYFFPPICPFQSKRVHKYIYMYISFFPSLGIKYFAVSPALSRSLYQGIDPEPEADGAVLHRNGTSPTQHVQWSLVEPSLRKGKNRYTVVLV